MLLDYPNIFNGLNILRYDFHIDLVIADADDPVNADADEKAYAGDADADEKVCAGITVVGLAAAVSSKVSRRERGRWLRGGCCRKL